MKEIFGKRGFQKFLANKSKKAQAMLGLFIINRIKC